MTSRNYDLILTLSTAATDFTAGNNIIGNSTLTTGMVVAVDYTNNKLKVKLNNLQQEFSTTEKIHSNTIITAGTANGSLNSLSLPFISNTMISNVTTAHATISAIAPSSFIAEKNAFTQNPVVRLYSIYYPGEWYPPNAKGNPTEDGAGYAWPNNFPLRLAEIIGDVAEDVSYNVSYDSTSYLSFPVTVSGLDQSSDGKINELSLTVFNADNIISALVEDPYLLGRTTSNTVYATVNGELVYGIDPQTVDADAIDYTLVAAQTAMAAARAVGLVYDPAIVGYYGRANASFDKTRADATGSGWTRLKMDTRDLLGSTVEIKTTFANFLDYWPEYSKVTSSSNTSISVNKTFTYRVGDTVQLDSSAYSKATIVNIPSDSSLTLDKPIAKYKYLGSLDTAMQGLTFKPDGYKAYFVGATNDKVYEHNLSTPWDITTATYLQNVSISAQDTSPTDLEFGNDGGYMYIVGSQKDNINRYTLSTAWNVQTATFNQTFNVAPYEINPGGLSFDTTGSNVYILGGTSNKVFQFNLATAWSLATASYLQNVSTVSQETNSTDLHFKSDGTRFYITGVDNDKIHQYDLSTAWNVTTSTYTGNTYIGMLENTPTYISLDTTGTILYIGGTDNVYQVALSNPWDVTSIDYSIPVGSPLLIVNPQADTSSYLLDTYKIDQLESLTEYVATFGLVSWLQYFKIVTPKRKYYKNTCQWRYKGEECQYPGYGAANIPGTNPVLTANPNPIAANNMIMAITGNSVIDNAADVCAKSLAACTLRNNQQHFGGFPGVGRTVPQM